MIEFILWMPLGAGLLACAMPKRWVPVPPLLLGVAQLGMVIALISTFDPALALYPGLILSRSDDSVNTQLSEVSPQGTEVARR